MNAYKHVFIIGIDGAGHGFKFTDTPRMDEIFAHGATTSECLTSIPTISAECWGSLLIGVTPEVHGLTNDIVSQTPYTNREYPTIFSLARKKYPDAPMACFCDWFCIRDGIVERDIGVVTDGGEDAVLAKKVADHIKSSKPTLMFVQFDSVDHVGHETGYNNEIYYKKITEIDGYIGQIFDSVKDAGLDGESLFIVTADHGGIDRFHGGTTDEEKYVFFGARGKTVAEMHDFKMNIRDIPAITCRALGADGNPKWDSVVPSGLFTE